MKTSLLLGTLALGATLAAATYFIVHTAPNAAASVEPAMYDAALDLNAQTTLMTIHARDALAAADADLRYLVARRDDAGRGLIHSKHRGVLSIAPMDTERFDDARIMRMAARRDAEAFIERYTHNGGLK